MGRDYSKKEPFRDFKSRVMDPISKTYCGDKWYYSTIWLAHGQTASCHHPPQHNIDVDEIKTNPSAIHNTQHKKLMRKMMLAGERPPECEYCWKVEDMDRDALSDRVFKTYTHSDEDIAVSAKLPWDSDVMPKVLEIMFDPTCNFACSYCNSKLSTSWGRDLKQNGPYTNLISDGAGAYTKIHPWNAANNEENNPYIQAFWLWWESDLADNLEEIRITGGEPLMSTSVWRLFQWFKDNPDRAKKLRFGVNSNLVPKPELIDKLIELSHNIPHLKIYTSNESVGAHSDYIRDGMEYTTWWNNIERLQTEADVKSMIVMMTLNSLCLASLTEFMDDILAFRRRHQTTNPAMAIQVLRYPSFQSVAILPIEIKQFYKDKLLSWLDNRLAENETINLGASTTSLLSQKEIEKIKWFIDYLDIVKTPHNNTADQAKLYNDFKNFYEQYDQRRNKNFRATFPKIFVDFIDSIETIAK